MGENLLMESRSKKQELEVRGVMGVSPGPYDLHLYMFLNEEENLGMIFCWYISIIATKEKRMMEKHTFLYCLVRK